ncbi:MAG: hypothetical protein GC134_04070 [Proteobacteria bacterium]|nr:hypothetical protein [Pseudomonadota bacterium]
MTTPPKARAQFRAMLALAGKGDASALYEVGMAYYSGKFAAFGTKALKVTVNRKKALELLLKAANGGHAGAQMAAGYALVRKTCGVQDFTKGIALLQKSAEAGNPHASQELAEISDKLQTLASADPSVELVLVEDKA